MLLSAYLEDRNLTRHEFSKKCKISPLIVYDLIEKGRNIRASTLLKMEEATGGKCTMQEICREFIVNRDKKKIE